MPLTLELRAKNGSGIPAERKIFLNNQRKQTVVFETAFPVTDVIIDPDSAILAERTNYLTSVSDATSQFNTSMIYPNPAQNSVTVSLFNPQNQHYHISILNNQGKEIAIIHEGFIPAGEFLYSWDIRHIVSGLYTVLIRTHNSMQALPCTIYH
jgi:hypothetical protein